MSQRLDVRIVGGTLIDGSGAPGIRGDLGVRDGRIVEMGQVGADASQTIDAGGLAVAPGFVDMHTHYDAQVFWDPTVSPSSRHGVTTIVGGNCGFSIAPLNGKREDAEYLMRMLARVEGMPLESLRAGVPWNWKSFGEYLGLLDGKLAVNAAFMVGHSAIRRAVMGARAVGEKSTSRELAAMQALLDASIAEGGLGFSTTVSPSHNDGEGNPVPSRHASDEELVELARTVGRHPGTSIEFLPNITGEFTNAQKQLMTDMSLAAGRPLNWNVLQPDARLPDQIAAQMDSADYAAARGARVVPLVGGTPTTLRINLISGFVFDTFPGWTEFIALPVEEKKRRLRDPAVLESLEGRRLDHGGSLRAITMNWAAYGLGEIHSAAYKDLEGMTVGEAAQRRGRRPFELMIEIALADDLKTTFLLPPRGADDETWKIRGRLWTDERTVLGASDAGAHLDMLDAFATATLVLSVGVRERRLLSLEQAVRQLSSVPAELLGIRGRGRLAVGNHADIVVFDPATVARGPVYTRDDLPAGASRLYADAIGIRHVFVNGREIVRGSDFLGAFPGTVLRSGRDTDTVALAPARRAA